MKKISLLLLTAIISMNCFAEIAFNTALREVSADLAQKLNAKGKKRVVVLYVTDINKSKTIAGKYIANKISENIVNDPANFQVFDRDNLEGIAEVNKLVAEGYLDQTKTQEIGRLLSVDVIVVGTYTILSNTMQLTTKGIDVNSALVMANSSKEIILDNDAGALLGINISSSSNNAASINANNRGFNNVPLNSGENYNNPETVDKSCATNNTGDFCFKNNTNKRIQLRTKPSSSSNDRQCSSKNYNDIIIEVGETKCMYSLSACPTYYYVVKEATGMGGKPRFPIGTSDHYTQGQILIEQCKSKTLEIR